ncbi:hypothetical protein A2U01_0004064 [Trifolium medium]|uniref:Uncharacterized protein n=1 Tax=Trifolium medium TaxID=97028 RepID=A0A392M758_9FABA|nr:hypothetical protein [Trifolium medium]
MENHNESYWGGGGGYVAPINKEREEEIEDIWKTKAARFKSDDPDLLQRPAVVEGGLIGDGGTIYKKQKEVEDNKGTLEKGN